jgi:RimJ/RimL family protein N-acetyltransferase
VTQRHSDEAGNEVALRDVTEPDIQVFFENQSDPEGAEMAAVESRDRDAHAAHWVKILGDDTLVARTILFDGEVAGNVVSWEHAGRRLVGYWIGRSFWGRGIATRALARFLDELGHRPLFALVAKHNVGSIRVLEKCGFSATGGSSIGEDGVEELEMVLD